MTRRKSDAGSVLMLVPAAVLVLLVLGAICVDSAIVFLAQRDLANRTAAAANDIAGFAVSDAGFYSRAGEVSLDDRRANAYAQLAFAPDRLPGGYASWSAAAETQGRQVTVVARARVRYVFARAVPGAPDTAHVEARSTASIRGA